MLYGAGIVLLLFTNTLLLMRVYSSSKAKYSNASVGDIYVLLLSLLTFIEHTYPVHYCSKALCTRGYKYYDIKSSDKKTINIYIY